MSAPGPFTEKQLAALAGVTTWQLGYWRRKLHMIEASEFDPGPSQSGTLGGLRAQPLYTEADLLRVRLFVALLQRPVSVEDIARFVRENGAAIESVFVSPPSEAMRETLRGMTVGTLDICHYTIPRPGGRFVSVSVQKNWDPELDTFTYTGKIRDGHWLRLDEVMTILEESILPSELGRNVTDPDMADRIGAAARAYKERFVVPPGRQQEPETPGVTMNLEQTRLFFEENPTPGVRVSRSAIKKQRAERVSAPPTRKTQPESANPQAQIQANSSTLLAKFPQRRSGKRKRVADGKPRPEHAHI